jgi:glycosyltransferase involved in cell wall biosynthesis
MNCTHRFRGWGCWLSAPLVAACLVSIMLGGARAHKPPRRAQHIAMVSSHTRADWALPDSPYPAILGQEQQGGQSSAMLGLGRAFARQAPGLKVDLWCDFRHDDPHVERSQLLRLDGAGFWVHPIGEGVNVIRAPTANHNNSDTPRESRFCFPYRHDTRTAQLAHAMRRYARHRGFGAYQIVQGEYPDGGDVGRRYVRDRPAGRLPLLGYRTHSVGKIKRAQLLQTPGADAYALDQRYRFPQRDAVEEACFERVDRLFALSTPEADFIKRNYTSVGLNDPRVVVVPNGIEPEERIVPTSELQRQLAVELRERGLRDDSLVLGCIARLDRRKGQATLLEALARLPPRLRQRTQVLFAGWPDAEGDYGRELRQFVGNNGLQSNVVTLPPVPRDQVWALMERSDAVVAPGWEGFAMVSLEAGLAGRPFIGRRDTGAVDLLGADQYGLLIEPNDSRDLMRALQKIHDMGPDGRRAMGEAARRNVLRDFTWDAVAGRMLEHYQQAGRSMTTKRRPQPRLDGQQAKFELEHVAEAWVGFTWPLDCAVRWVSSDLRAETVRQEIVFNASGCDPARDNWETTGQPLTRRFVLELLDVGLRRYRHLLEEAPEAAAALNRKRSAEAWAADAGDGGIGTYKAKKIVLAGRYAANVAKAALDAVGQLKEADAPEPQVARVREAATALKRLASSFPQPSRAVVEDLDFWNRVHRAEMADLEAGTGP